GPYKQVAYGLRADSMARQYLVPDCRYDPELPSLGRRRSARASRGLAGSISILHAARPAPPGLRGIWTSPTSSYNARWDLSKYHTTTKARRHSTFGEQARPTPVCNLSLLSGKCTSIKAYTYLMQGFHSSKKAITDCIARVDKRQGRANNSCHTTTDDNKTISDGTDPHDKQDHPAYSLQSPPAHRC